MLSWTIAYQLLHRDAHVRKGQKSLLIGAAGSWFATLWWWNRFSGARTASFVSITSLRKAHPDWFLADLGRLLGLLARGDIKPRVAERIGLDAVADAHRRLEHGGLEGKIVLVPNPGVPTPTFTHTGTPWSCTGLPMDISEPIGIVRVPEPAVGTRGDDVRTHHTRIADPWSLRIGCVSCGSLVQCAPTR